MPFTFLTSAYCSFSDLDMEMFAARDAVRKLLPMQLSQYEEVVATNYDPNTDTIYNRVQAYYDVNDIHIPLDELSLQASQSYKHNMCSDKNTRDIISRGVQIVCEYYDVNGIKFSEFNITNCL